MDDLDFVSTSSCSSLDDYSNKDVDDLNDLLTLIYRHKRLHRISSPHDLKTRLLDELGLLFSLKNLWSFTKTLVEININVSLESDEEAIAHFVKEAEKTELPKLIMDALSHSLEENDANNGLITLVFNMVLNLDLYNYTHEEALPLIMKELGMIFRMKQLWLRSALLRQMDRLYGLYTTYYLLSEVIDEFVDLAGSTKLSTCVSNWATDHFKMN